MGLVLLAWSAAATAHAPHVHGQARLEVVLDGQALIIALESPLDNLVGFEHAPRTEAHRAAWRNMETILRQPASLFAPSVAAGCKPEEVSLSSPVWDEVAGEHPAHDHSHDHSHGHGHSHDHSHNSNNHHADLYAEYVFRCDHPERLDAIDVNLFMPFARLQRINAEVATPDGQTAQRLDARNLRLHLR